MFAYFHKLPALFGGRIIGRLYFGAFAKVQLDPDSNNAKVFYFGGEKLCRNQQELEHEVAKILRNRHAR
jgi:hypothetical protein